MANFRLTDDMFYDIKSGSAIIQGDSKENLQSYAVLVKSGHCGAGYYMPIIMTIMARDKESAIKLAENAGRVKKSSKHAILTVEKISELEYWAIEYINACDPYLKADYNNELFPEMLDRRIILPATIDKELKNTKHYKGDFVLKRKPNYRKVPKESVKTADQYDEKYVLQRYLAPVRYGDKLIFPRRFNLKIMLKEFLEQNLRRLGTEQTKASALSFYYQIFGLHNNLELRYQDKCLIFKDENGAEQYIKVPDAMVPHLSKAKRKFVEEEERLSAENNAEENTTPTIVLASKRDAFNRRYKKYQQLKQDKVK